jgi:parallel beta-helix repeat protein
MKLTFSLFVCLLGGAAHSFAINCGDTVSGNVTLNADLVCNDKNGLIVGASNTTINLNGHTISCVGGGFKGSCQTTDGIDGAGLWRRGIFSQGFYNVKILGPGTIEGFTWNVSLWNGGSFVVENVELSGPVVPLWENLRGIGVGVQVRNSPCPIVAVVGRPAPPTAVISNNEVKGVGVGIAVEESSCVTVRDNIIHHVNRAPGYAFGIGIYRSSSNNVYRNSITNVGVNRAGDAGIYLWQSQTHTNDVFSNVVTNNCGHGVWAVNSTHDNKIRSNTVKYNGDPQASFPSCEYPQQKYYDLNENSNGAGNVWNANNVCRTQNGSQIPVGVCKLNE